MRDVMEVYHRWTAATALARWTRDLERAGTRKFAKEMPSYKHSRIFDVLMAAKGRRELKHVRKCFLTWKRRVRLARVLEYKASSYITSHRARYLTCPADNPGIQQAFGILASTVFHLATRILDVVVFLLRVARVVQSSKRPAHLLLF